MLSTVLSAVLVGVSSLAALFIIRFIYYVLPNKRLCVQKDCEKIYFNLGCYELPFEIFYGINFAFYRTFCSPSISGLYHYTRTIEDTTHKRVTDTDIIMHSWFDYGLDSEKGSAAWQHLNRIHGSFKTKNRDFIYVLCCFIVDTIRFTEVFGWRRLTAHEQQAVYHFWAQVGVRMNLQDIPTSLAEAYEVVDEYVRSETTSRKTEGGYLLTMSINRLLGQWYPFIPGYILNESITALMFVLGGPVFVEKCGLPRPNQFFVKMLYALGWIRGLAMTFAPPRLTPHRLSALYLAEIYRDSNTGIEKVGPVSVLDKLARADIPATAEAR